MRRSPLAAAVVLLALTGCSAAEDEAPRETPQETPAPTVEEPVEESAPLTAVEEPETATGEDVFLAEIRKIYDVPTFVEATDQQLIDAGWKACELLAANPRAVDLRLIEGEVPNGVGHYLDSISLANVAQEFLCPEVPIDLSPV